MLVAGAAGLVWWAAGRPAPPSSPGPGEDYSDELEDAVMEIEEMLLDLARQIEGRAWGGALYHLTEDFEGTPFFREPDGAEDLVGGVKIRKGGADPRRVDREGWRGGLEEIELDSLLFKLPAAHCEVDRVRSRLKIDARTARDGRALRRVSEGPAEFLRQAGRWRLRRFSAESIAAEDGPVRFLDVTDAVGLRRPSGFIARPDTDLTYAYLFLGGVAAGDLDGDGDDDLYMPRVGPNACYRNEGGRFTECAAAWGVSDPDAGAGAVVLDYDNDGDLDLLVTNYEPARLRDLKTGKIIDNAGRRALVLYRNEGGGRFADATRAAGLLARGPATSACAADVDRDGDLDLYVCMYEENRAEDPRKDVVVPTRVFAARDGVPNQLWINRGDGTFAEEAARRGVADTGWSLAAAFADYDEDGDPDLYVANDYGQHRLFRNRGDGAFDDVTATSGAGDTGFGMGVTWFDYDGDGRLDLYVSNMYSTAGNRILGRGPGKLRPEDHAMLLKMARGNTLLRNLGGGKFEDVTASTGGGRAGWAWGSAEFDHDNDGVPDLYVVNGFRTSEFATSDL